MKLSDVVSDFNNGIQQCVSLSQGALHLKCRVILDTFGVTNAGRHGHPFSNTDGYVRSGGVFANSDQHDSLYCACVTEQGQVKSYCCHSSAWLLMTRMKKKVKSARSRTFFGYQMTRLEFAQPEAHLVSTLDLLPPKSIKALLKSLRQPIRVAPRTWALTAAAKRYLAPSDLASVYCVSKTMHQLGALQRHSFARAQLNTINGLNCALRTLESPYHFYFQLLKRVLRSIVFQSAGNVPLLKATQACFRRLN